MHGLRSVLKGAPGLSTYFKTPVNPFSSAKRGTEISPALTSSKDYLSPDVEGEAVIEDAYGRGVRCGSLAYDPLALARFLADRVVAVGRHFLVIDKPANLSVWGHSQSSSTHQAAASSPPLSIRECLPHLRSVIAEEGYGPISSTSEAQSPRSFLLSAMDELSPEGGAAFPPPSELFIVEPLPAAYSGLILLSTSSVYADFARGFYSDAVRSTFPGSMYQTFCVACWGHPSREAVDHERFPLAVHKASETISVAYRPTNDAITGSAWKRHRLMQKHVAHRVLSRGSEGSPACFVEITCNSCYAGLPEVYLLHEGCEVIGEDLQASRLVRTKNMPMVLAPTMAYLGAPLPEELARALGAEGLQRAAVPTHIHRSQLLIPPPLPLSETFSRKHRKPIGKILDSKENAPVLSWKSYRVNEENKKKVFYLSAASPSLPSYFTRSLEKLGLDSTFPLRKIEKS